MPLSRYHKSQSSVTCVAIGSNAWLDGMVISLGTNNVVAESEALAADSCILDSIEVPRFRRRQSAKRAHPTTTDPMKFALVRLRQVVSVPADAVVADEYRRSGDELLDLLVGSLTERAAERIRIHRLTEREAR